MSCIKCGNDSTTDIFGWCRACRFSHRKAWEYLHREIEDIDDDIGEIKTTSGIAFEIRTSKTYRTWKRLVMEDNNNGGCIICGSKSNLHIHHKVRFSSILYNNRIDNLDDALQCDELWNISNGMVLCAYCHSMEHPNHSGLILSLVK